jgi:thiamine biosynthesis lipoprotein
MGMEVRILMDADDEPTARRAGQAAFATIAELEGRLSDYRPDSDLRAIERAAPNPVQVHPDVFAVLAHALEVARLTDGAFDPTIAPLVALWRESRDTGRLPADDALREARALVDWSRVEVTERTSGVFFVRLPVAGMRLDLGGIAKGYILQRAIRTLRDEGVPRAFIEAGGDIVAGERRLETMGWAVALSEGCEALGYRFANGALATSGVTMQWADIAGTRYSHVVNPRTGLGLTRHRTVHVRARDGATADAWATALSVVSPVQALNLRLPRGVQVCVAR